MHEHLPYTVLVDRGGGRNSGGADETWTRLFVRETRNTPVPEAIVVVAFCIAHVTMNFDGDNNSNGANHRFGMRFFFILFLSSYRNITKDCSWAFFNSFFRFSRASCIPFLSTHFFLAAVAGFATAVLCSVSVSVCHNINIFQHLNIV